MSGEARPLLSPSAESAGSRFRHDAGDAAETDDFLRRLTSGDSGLASGARGRRPGGAIQRGSSNSATAADLSDSGVVSSAAAQPGKAKVEPSDDANDDDDDRRDNACCLRFTLVTLGILFLSGSAALIALVLKTQQYLRYLFPAGFIVLLCIGAVYGVSSILLIASALTNRDKHRRAALFLFSVATAGVIGAMAVSALVSSGSLEKRMAADWNSAAVSDASRMCSFERELQCSGWRTPCPSNGTVAPTTTAAPAPATTAVPAAPSPAPLPTANSTEADENVLGRLLAQITAIDGKTNSTVCPICTTVIPFNTSCSSALQDRCHRDLPIFCSVGALSIIATIGLCVLVMRRAVKDETQIRFRGKKVR